MCFSYCSRNYIQVKIMCVVGVMSGRQTVQTTYSAHLLSVICEVVSFMYQSL
jgi:hypothetical protein